ncbi:hypothetical protein KIPB_008590, partial [Kipferlia bialata]|eukprot:g8590.t1
MNRNARRLAAEELLASFKSGVFHGVPIKESLAASKAGTVRYTPENCPEVQKGVYETRVHIEHTTTTESARKWTTGVGLDGASPASVGVLNFASAKNPGGGFLK